MNKVDFKKELKELYIPSAKKPVMINVPELKFIMLDGSGNPNTAQEFQNAVQALYGIAFGIKMLPKKGITPDGYFDYVVPPLEGCWDTLDHTEFDFSNKDNLKWTVMIMQPAFVNAEIFEQVKTVLKEKKNNPAISNVRFESFTEGLCAQVLHIGPYDNEPATLERLETFITEQGYKAVKSGHHEIYLSDPRRCNPDKLKTTLRYPVIPV